MFMLPCWDSRVAVAMWDFSFWIHAMSDIILKQQSNKPVIFRMGIQSTNCRGCLVAPKLLVSYQGIMFKLPQASQSLARVYS